MKIDTLSFLNCLLVNHAPSVFHPHIQVIVPVCTKSRFVNVQIIEPGTPSCIGKFDKRLNSLFAPNP